MPGYGTMRGGMGAAYLRSDPCLGWKTSTRTARTWARKALGYSFCARSGYTTATAALCSKGRSTAPT
jgi:hypothetical protein